MGGDFELDKLFISFPICRTFFHILSQVKYSFHSLILEEKMCMQRGIPN